MNEKLKILVLDDEPKMGKVLARVLEREGHRAESASAPEEGLAKLAEGGFDLLLTDLRMPGLDGMEVMKRAREADPRLDVVMMTAYASVENAVEAMKLGAADYLIKPFHNEELILLASRIAERRALAAENASLKESLGAPLDTSNLVAVSSAMNEVLRRVRKVAATDVSVLLRGESGTGKEVLASLIHASGPRAKQPFIRVNCGALPENLLESELFGHVRGAFTGAVETRKGLFSAADKGCIFLDEIGEVTPALQVKLLRVLQCGEFQRVGDPATFKVDVRVLAATNRALEDLIEQGKFRSDLYYRLNVVPIVIPPLRERAADVPALIDHFLAKLRTPGAKLKRISRAAYELLLAYPWPGNIRELENAIEHAIVMSEGESIEIEDLPLAIQNHGSEPPAPAASGPPGAAGASPPSPSAAPPTLEDVEKRLLLEALQSTGFNHTRAARKLGITRRTLGYRLEKYGLPRRAAGEDESPSESPAGGNGLEGRSVS